MVIKVVETANLFVGATNKFQVQSLDLKLVGWQTKEVA
jgi:hypothetical protein